MKILLATPLYPPDIGGPAQYALHLHQELKKRHMVKVLSFRFERALPSFIRHIVYMLRAMPLVLWADRVVMLDAASVGIPAAFLCRLFKRKYIVRLGGDFLWEMYVERTGEEIPLSEFYVSKNVQLSKKELYTQKLTAYVLRNADRIAINTEWLRGILAKGYNIPPDVMTVIENYFAGITPSEIPTEKLFIASSRDMKLKNKKRVEKSFRQIFPAVKLEANALPFEKLQQRIRTAYAVVVLSYSEVNPNLVLDGLAQGKPFILTKYTGIHERFKQFGILVDPFDVTSIKQGINKICEGSFYEALRNNIAAFRYSHTWEQIAEEFEKIL